MKKISHKQMNKFYLISVSIGLIIALIGAGTDLVPIIVIGMIIMLGTLILKLLFYRCPHCAKYLDRNTGDYCPHCGQKLEDIKL